jgi:hypothetical protein
MQSPSVCGAVDNAWLFVRGNDSVRLVRTERNLLVLGPGTQRMEHVTETDEAANRLQRQIEAELRRQGWVFEGYGVERRQRPDRRRIPRWSERRHQP